MKKYMGSYSRKDPACENRDTKVVPVGVGAEWLDFHIPHNKLNYLHGSYSSSNIRGDWLPAANFVPIIYNQLEEVFFWVHVSGSIVHFEKLIHFMTLSSVRSKRPGFRGTSVISGLPYSTRNKRTC